MILLVDYGMGNLKSVANALDCLGSPWKISADPGDLRSADAIIIPGVGAFADGMANLRQLGFVDALQEEVLEKQKPILGICLGMQFLADRSFEGGESAGLGFIEGDVIRLTPDNNKFKVPHMGWNNLEYKQSDCPLFNGIGADPVFYFVHSFQFMAHDEYVVAVCSHGGSMVAAVQRGNIYGVQFHPEKSQGMGLKLLKNFCDVSMRT